VLVPLQCEYFALEGISMVNRLLAQIRDSGENPSLRLLGIVMTMYDGRTRLSQQVLDEVRNHFSDIIFETTIPRATRLAEAPSHGQPALVYDPDGLATAAYDVLGAELVQRLSVEELTPDNVVDATALQKHVPMQNQA